MLAMEAERSAGRRCWPRARCPIRSPGPWSLPRPRPLPRPAPHRAHRPRFVCSFGCP